MNRKNRQPRGMAVVIVIVLIGVLAVVLTSVAGRAVVDQRRGADAGEAVQVSRLLAAAAQIARQQVADSKTRDGPVETPLGRVTLAWHGTEPARACEVNIELGHIRRTAMFAFAGSQLGRMD